MSSPEPRISSDSTTGARGSSGALIGPSARRRRGLWGNRIGSRGWRRRRWKTRGKRGVSGCARRPGRALGAARCAGSSPWVLRDPTRVLARGVWIYRRRGAHLRLYRAGGDSGIARDVTSRPPPWVEAAAAPEEVTTPKPHTDGGTPPTSGIESRWEEMEMKPLAANRKNIRFRFEGGSGGCDLVSDKVPIFQALWKTSVYTSVGFNITRGRDSLEQKM